MAGESEFYAVEEESISPVAEADQTIQVDPEDELVEIFIEEGEELVDECDATMQRWEDEGFDDNIISELQKHYGIFSSIVGLGYDNFVYLYFFDRLSKTRNSDRF